MNLRLPIVGAIVAVAAGAAYIRTTHESAPPSPFLTDTPSTTRDLASTPRVRMHGARDRPDSERAGTIVVYVAGEVAHAGLYKLPPSARAVDALHAAGGPTNVADLVAVNLALPLSDGDELAVPSISEDAPAAAAHRSTSHRKKHKRHKGKHKRRRHHRTAPSSDASDPAADSSPGTPDDTVGNGEPTTIVDLNTAGESELETLPGVGATLAQRIVSFRELTGPFASTDDLLDVSGVTQSKLDEMSPYISAVAPNVAP